MEKNKEVPGFELTNFDCTKANTKREQKKKKRTKRCLVSNSRTLTAWSAGLTPTPQWHGFPKNNHATFL